MKSLHYDQCLLLFFYTYIHVYSLFHRDETKPTHIIEINSFLFLMQLIYKHSSPNYQHMISYRQLINKIRHYIYICVCWNIFNRIHFFAICDVFLFMWLVRLSCEIHIMINLKSWRSSFDKLLFFWSSTIYITLLINCINTTVLAEQSLHHNIILENKDHS